MTPPKTQWTGAQKLRVVLAAHGLRETELGALLRREGLHAAQLDEWRAAAETALEPTSRRREKAVPHPDTKRLADVERELRRKEKALAEAAALLVLKKTGDILGGRGRYHGPDERAMIVAAIETAVATGARYTTACALVGLSVRTLERWRGAHPVDVRYGPKEAPANRYTDAERRAICTTVTQRAYRDLSPHQIVPRLADTGVYLASESTIYRVMRTEGLQTRRGRAKAPVVRHVAAQIAHGPNQVWSWDITYYY
jgi:transposase-like protein